MLKVQNLNISYQRKIMENVCFEAKCGEVTLIQGESGSGKTALLYRLALLTTQTDYDYSINNYHIQLSSDHIKANLRRYHIAYVLQDAILIDYYNVKENIVHYARMVHKELSDEQIQDLFNLVHLNIPLNQSIETLSGGERQRLAIACALAKDSEVIILDEPTSCLDSQNEENILKLIQQLAKTQNKCIILASHSPKAIQYADSIYQIENCHLTCVSHTTYNDQREYVNQKQQSEIKFLNRYVKRYFHIFKRKQRNMILIIALSFLMIFLVMSGIHYYQKMSRENILKISDNQVYLTSKKNGQFVKETDQVVEENLLDLLPVDKAYPYIYSKMTLSDQVIDILPYFEENNINDKLEYQYHLLDKNAIILSYDTYQFMKRHYISTNYFDNNIDIRIEKENGFQWTEKRINQNIKGVLKDGEINHYSTNKYCIYVPYQLLIQLYQQETSYNHFIGYTVFSHDFESHIKLVEKIKKSDQITINDDFQNTSILDQMNQYTKKIKDILIPIIIIGTIYIISIMSVHHFQYRKKEFVLSMINGLGNKQIMKIIILEIIDQVMLALCLFAFILILMLFLFPIEVNILYQNIIWILIEISLLIICMIIMNYIQMKNLSIEEVLRNE